MRRTKRRSKIKRIAIAIEMDQPYPHHLGCYDGITRYAAGKSDWRTALDPFLVGVAGDSGVRQYDGIVGRITGKGGAEARAAGIPAVNLWINSPARDLPSVLPDCRAGCRMAAEHLMARGFRRFAFVGAKRDRCRRLQLAGFEAPLKEMGYSVDKLDVPQNCEAGAGPFIRFYHELKAWLAALAGPVALLVPLELNGLYIVQICGELGLRIPHDVGIVVCRDNLTICTQSTPTITGIEDDNQQIGYQAAKLLDQIMLGKTEEPDEPIWVAPKTLRVRASSDAFVSKDPLVSSAMRFIADNAHRAIKLEHVAEAVGTSKQTLRLRFVQHIGCSVYSEINRLRIERVKRQLIDSDEPLEELAHANGFTDLSHLIKNFRKATGDTPGRFRKSHRAS